MSTLLGKWLNHYDPLNLGWTPRGIANAVCATGGWFFPRVRGGHNLYRGTPGPAAIDYARPVGAAGPDSGRIGNFPWCPHQPEARYAYAVRAIGGGGVESEASEPPVRVSFDSTAQRTAGRPDPPASLRARPAPGGAFELRWTYQVRPPRAEPVTFHVFGDHGTGEVEYGQPVVVVPFGRGRFHYQTTTPTCGHGSRRRWAVRAVSADGLDDGHAAFVEVVADAEPPPAFPPGPVGLGVEY